ncbi:MAG: hypothetical protein IJ538_03130 [Clostridia bacterium]|nr:hypothetical protein [Clostridia bacterium]
MDTETKFGLTKNNAMMLFLQMILTIVGFVAQIGLLTFIVKNGLNNMLANSIAIILSFLSLFVYALFGYGKSKFYYIAAIAFFLLAILINNILPYRDTFQKILLTLLFGTMGAFMVAQDKFKLANILIFVAAILSLTFSIYSTITANVETVGDLSKTIVPVVMMYVSIFTPIIMTGAFGVTYLTRAKRKIRRTV